MGAPRSARPGAYRATFIALTLAAMTFALLQSLVVPALPEIRDNFGISQTATTWVLTINLLTASVFTPIIGRFGDMFGKRRVMVITLVVLAFGTVLAALATDIGVLLLARAIQGTGGAVFPLAFGIIRDEFPREKVMGAIAMISALLAIGGGLGVVLSGPILDAFGYHWLFWMPAVLVVIAAVVSARFIPESPVRAPGKIDWIGAALLSGWLSSLLVAISQSSVWGWDHPATIFLIASTVLLFVTWVKYEGRIAEPMVDMAIMRSRAVWTVNASAFLVGATMFSSFILFPEFTQTDPSHGYGFAASTTEAGLFMAPTTFIMLIASPLAGRLSNRIGPRIPLIIGCVGICIGFCQLALAHAEPWQVYLSSTILGVGVGFAFASLANLIVIAVPPEQTGVATGINQVMRTVGGSVGTQVVGSVLAGGILAAAVPTESAFTLTFWLSAAGGLLAAVFGLLAPRARAGPPTEALRPQRAEPNAPAA